VKKDENKDGWFAFERSEWYKEGLKERHKIEKNFGDARKWYRLIWCRYQGLTKHAIQSYLTFMALNLNRTKFSN